MTNGSAPLRFFATPISFGCSASTFFVASWISRVSGTKSPVCPVAHFRVSSSRAFNSSRTTSTERTSPRAISASTLLQNVLKVPTGRTSRRPLMKADVSNE
jgi:hypothetical protein